MTITDIASHNNHKLSIYLSKFLSNKRYTKTGRKSLIFTKEEAREALMKAMRVSISKKDIKLFLQELRRTNEKDMQ